MSKISEGKVMMGQVICEGNGMSLKLQFPYTYYIHCLARQLQSVVVGMYMRSIISSNMQIFYCKYCSPNTMMNYKKIRSMKLQKRLNWESLTQEVVQIK